MYSYSGVQKLKIFGFGEISTTANLKHVSCVNYHENEVKTIVGTFNRNVSMILFNNTRKSNIGYNIY